MEKGVKWEAWQGGGGARLAEALSFIQVVYDGGLCGHSRGHVLGLTGINSMFPTSAECLLCTRLCVKGFLSAKLLPSQEALESSVNPRRVAVGET